MIEFAKGNGGWPWHGIFRSSTGKITAPNGVQVDAPWPSSFINSGECWQIKIPGLPEPTTSAADLAQGRTWVNYGLIAGNERTLYGVHLGSDASIYLDSHDKPWLMRLVVGGSRASASIGATVSLKRFGVVGPEETPHFYPISVATFSKSPDYPYAGAGYGVHLDISRNGREHLVAIQRDSAASPNGWTGYACIAKVTVSGSPDDGDVAVAISVLADETAESWDATTIWTGGGGVYPWYDYATDSTGVAYGNPDATKNQLPNMPGANSRSNSRLVLGGARFSASGSPQILMVRAEYRREVILDSETIGYKSYTQIGRDIESVLMSLELSGSVIGSSGLTRTTAFTQTTAPSGSSCTATETTDEGGMTYVKSYGIPNQVVSATSRNGWFGYEVASPADLDKFGIAQRLSNTVYSLRSWGYDSTDGSGLISPTRLIFGPAVGIIGSDPTTTALPASPSSAHPTFATEHPVTGEVVRSNTSVCWV